MTTKRLQAMLFGVTPKQADVLKEIANLWGVIYSDGDLADDVESQP